MVQRNSVNLWKSQINFTLVLCKSAQKHCLAQQCRAVCATYLLLWLETLLPELGTTCRTRTCVDGLDLWELPLLFPKIFFMLLQASGSSALLLALPLWGAKQSGQHWLMNGAQQQEVFHPGLFIVAPGFTQQNSFTHKTSLMLSLIQCMATVP